MFQCKGYTVCCFGHVGQTKHSNKSCGCLIAVRTSSFSKIHTIYEPDGQIKGRAGAIRITRPDIDILLVCMYFPPNIGTNVKKTSQLVANWVRKMLAT